MIYEYPPFNALTRPAKAFRVAADIAQAFGSMIWMIILLTGLVLSGLGVAHLGAEFGATDSWIRGCAVFADAGICTDTQEAIELRRTFDLPVKGLSKEELSASRRARIAELCKGLPDKLAAYAHCPGRD